MVIHPVLLAVWAVLAACFFGLLVYRGQLSRYEDDQIFLNTESQAHEEQHTAIVRRVKQIQPLVRVIGGAAGLVTVSVVGIYVWQAWQNIR